MPSFKHLVTAEDDSFHTKPTDVALWSESAQFTAYDPECQIAVYQHWGLLGGEMWECNNGVFLPNGEILVSRTFAPRVEGEPMYTGQATIKPLEPLERWQMTYNGFNRRLLEADLAAAPLADGQVERVQVDVVGTAASPAYGVGMRTDAETMTAHDRNVAVSGHGLHIEQSLKVDGSLVIGGERIEYHGVGHRDHSCGPRSNGHMWRESWINGSFPSGRTFHLLEVFVTGRPTYYMGYVWDGENLLEVTNQVGPPQTGPLGEPRTYEATFDCALGSQRIEGELLGSFAMTVNSPHGMYPGAERRGQLTAEGPTKWRWDGEVGYGWTERNYTRGGRMEMQHADAHTGGDHRYPGPGVQL
jgi:hypothetical protein